MWVSAALVRLNSLGGSADFLRQTVKRTEPPFNIESVFKIKWTQLVLDGYQQLVEENDRVRRGDPNSMAISYFRYESFAGDSGTPYYRAIVCPAIVQGPSGFWEPWQQGLHVVSCSFPCAEAQILLTQFITVLSTIYLAELPMDPFDGGD